MTISKQKRRTTSPLKGIRNAFMRLRSILYSRGRSNRDVGAHTNIAQAHLLSIIPSGEMWISTLTTSIDCTSDANYGRRMTQNEDKRSLSYQYLESLLLKIVINISCTNQRTRPCNSESSVALDPQRIVLHFVLNRSKHE